MAYMFRGQPNDYLTLEEEVTIILSRHCFEFYLKLRKSSLRSGHKNILIIHIELFKLILRIIQNYASPSLMGSHE